MPYQSIYGNGGAVVPNSGGKANPFAGNYTPGKYGAINSSPVGKLLGISSIDQIKDLPTLKLALQNKVINRDQYVYQFSNLTGGNPTLKLNPLQKAANVAGNLGVSTGQSFKAGATGIARVLPGGTADLKAQQNQSNQSALQLANAKALLTQGKITPQQYTKLTGIAANSASSAQKATTKTVSALPTTGQVAGGLVTAGSFALPGTDFVGGALGKIAPGVAERVGTATATKTLGGALTKAGKAGLNQVPAGAVFGAGSGITAGDKGKKLVKDIATGAAGAAALGAGGSVLGSAVNRVLNLRKAGIPVPSSALDAHADTAQTFEKQALADSKTSTEPTATATPKQSNVPRANIKNFSGTTDIHTKTAVQDVIKQARDTPRPAGTVRVFQDDAKGKSSPWVFDNVDSLRAYKNNVTGEGEKFSFKDVPKDQLTPSRGRDHVFTINETPKVATESTTTGVTRAAGSATKAEQRAVEAGVLKEIPNKAGYSENSFKTSTANATNLANTDKQATLDIALRKNPNASLLDEISHRHALEEVATKEGDGEILRALAKAPSHTNVSEAGTTLGAEGFEADPNSAVAKIKSVIATREEAVKGRVGSVSKAITKEVSDSRTAIKAATPRVSKQTFAEFVESIKC